MPIRALIRHAASGRWLACERPVAILTAGGPAEVPAIIEDAERRARDEGLHAIGFVAYEAAPGFDAKLPTQAPGRIPPAWFALFESMVAVPPPGDARPCPLNWQPSLDAARYADAIAQIRRWIAAGDTYQVNFSYRLRAAMPPGLDPAALFAAMTAAQHGGYGAFLETDDWAICSASPELFFERVGRRLTSRPMKGTAARDPDAPDDAAQGRALRQSRKDRAEHLMITDMVRNDIGRLATAGSVTTAALFQLEAYPTLWTLTSTVQGDTAAPLAEVFRALFPAASITGAPKRRTMALISELEGEPRGIYTGSIGVIGPDGDAQFNVAIRTAWVDKAESTVEYGVGGGIVWDSDAAAEYAETRTKSRILTRAPAEPFALLETLLWTPEAGFAWLDDHLERLQRSAHWFCRHLSPTRIAADLAAAVVPLPQVAHRVRLLVHADGTREITASRLSAKDRPVRVTLATASADVLGNPFVCHKTTRREVYATARALARATAPRADDVLLVNARGEVTEATIANVVIDGGDGLLTPPVASGLLPGIQRQHLVVSGQVREQVLTRADVSAARQVYLANSVRGLWPVTLVKAAPHEDS